MSRYCVPHSCEHPACDVLYLCSSQKTWVLMGPQKTTGARRYNNQRSSSSLLLSISKDWQGNLKSWLGCTCIWDI